MIVKSLSIFVKYVLAALVYFLNALIKALGYTLEKLFFFLPDSPFRSFVDSFDTSMFAPLSHVLPVAQMAAVFQAWIVAVGIYYMYTIILRWFKVVE